MKRLAAVLALVTLALLPIAYAFSGDADAKGQSQPNLQKPTLIVNLTSSEKNLHGVAMGLHFAEHGLADGRQVVVFFNVKSPPLARKDLPDNVKFRDLPPVKEMIAKLLAGGAKMVVCPMCAEIMGVKAEDLAPGIEMIKDRKQIFDHVHANSVVFTY